MSQDWLGRDLVLGYGSTFIPTRSGRHEKFLELFAPSATSLWRQIMGILRGERPALVDNNDFLINVREKRETVRMESAGVQVKVVFNVNVENYEKLNLNFYHLTLSYSSFVPSTHDHNPDH